MSENLWDDPGVPHKGYTSLGVTDLEEATHVCDVCGKEEIRYVHHLIHPTAGLKDVGCVCAEKLTNDYITHREQLKEAVSATGKKERWLKKQWKETDDHVFKKTQTFAAEAVKIAPGHWQGQILRPFNYTFKTANRYAAKDKLQKAVQDYKINIT